MQARVAELGNSKDLNRHRWWPCIVFWHLDALLYCRCNANARVIPLYPSWLGLSDFTRATRGRVPVAKSLVCGLACCFSNLKGCSEKNPGPLGPKPRIIPLDQAAMAGNRSMQQPVFFLDKVKRSEDIRCIRYGMAAGENAFASTIRH